MEEQASDISKGKDYISSDCDNVVSDLEDAKKNILALILRNIDFSFKSSIKTKILDSIEEYHEKSIDLSKKLNLKITNLTIC